MKDLFLTEKLTKTANTVKVSPKAPDWGKEVLNRFYSDYPQLSNAQVRVSFKEKDEEKGYGVGSVNINGQLTLPVIIKDFQLFPMDVATTEESVIPFTDETIEMLQAKAPIFSQLRKKEGTDSFPRFFENPYGYGGPGYAIEKGASILDEINDKSLFQEETRAKFAELLANDLILQSKAEKNAAFRSGLEKIAKFTSIDTENITKEASHNIQYIFPQKNGQFTKISAFSAIDEVTIEKNLEKYEIKGEESIIALENEKTASFSPRVVTTEGFVYKLANNEDMFLDKMGNYRILVGKDYSMTKQAGFEDGNIDLLIDLSDIPAVGDKGVFFNPDDGEIKTAVVEMRKVAFIKGGLSRLEGEMAVGTRGITKFASLRGIDVPKWSNERNTLFFPEKWSFAKLGQELKETDLHETFNPKLAGLECVRCVGLDHYDYRGPVLKKYAERHNLYECPNHLAAFAVLHCGGSKEDVEKIASLEPGQTYIVRAELTLPIKHDVIVKEAERAVSDLIGEDDYIFDTEEVLKLAAEMGSETGVDSVLGTAFLRKDTLKNFIEMLPMFEEVASTLAKMLIYIRMGADGMGEIPTREAMKHISKVIYQLQGIKSMSKIK